MPILITPHAQREWGKVIGVGVLIYIYIYICLWTKKNLNRTLATDSPFQTFVVGKNSCPLIVHVYVLHGSRPR